MGPNDLDKLKEKVAHCCRIMYMEDLFASSGHVSARVPGTDHILIHPRQTSRSAVKGSEIVAVDLRGNLVEGVLEPPSETALHTSIYRARPDVLSVAHLHSHYATMISISGRPMVPVLTPGAIFAPEVPVFDDASLIQTDEQGDAVAAALGRHRAVLLRGHGSVVVAESVEGALAASIHFEENARKLFGAYQIGTPKIIAGEEAAGAAFRISGDKPIMKVWLHYQAKARAQGLIT